MHYFRVRLADGNVQHVLAPNKDTAYRLAVASYPVNARPLSSGISEIRPTVGMTS